MPKRLKDRSIQYIIRKRKNGEACSKIAEDLGITARHVRRLWARFQRTGTAHARMGRPRTHATMSQMRLVTDAYRAWPVGVRRTAMEIRKNHDISYAAICRIMKKNGMVASSEARSGKRRWVRYERRYSNAMWHVDWHEMRDPRFRGLNLVTYLDDASRCITGAALFEHATSENAVTVLRLAIRRFGAPASILSDNGSCFVGQGGRRKKDGGTWQPTAFEEELLERDIVLINSRPHHPQTNGKLERLHRSVEEEIFHYGTLGEYVGYYNESRLHFSLDIDHYETPPAGISEQKGHRGDQEKGREMDGEGRR